MTEIGATPISFDTEAFYAQADGDDRHHETTVRVFECIRAGDLSFRPVFTSHAVLSELATLALYTLGHDVAVRVLNAIRNSESINVVPVDREPLRPQQRSSRRTTSRRYSSSTILPAYSPRSEISDTSSRSTVTFEGSALGSFRRTSGFLTGDCLPTPTWIF